MERSRRERSSSPLRRAGSREKDSRGRSYESPNYGRHDFRGRGQSNEKNSSSNRDRQRGSPAKTSHSRGHISPSSCSDDQGDRHLDEKGGRANRDRSLSTPQKNEHRSRYRLRVRTSLSRSPSRSRTPAWSKRGEKRHGSSGTRSAGRASARKGNREEKHPRSPSRDNRENRHGGRDSPLRRSNSNSNSNTNSNSIRSSYDARGSRKDSMSTSTSPSATRPGRSGADNEVKDPTAKRQDHEHQGTYSPPAPVATKADDRSASKSRSTPLGKSPTSASSMTSSRAASSSSFLGLKTPSPSPSGAKAKSADRSSASRQDMRSECPEAPGGSRPKEVPDSPREQGPPAKASKEHRSKKGRSQGVHNSAGDRVAEGQEARQDKRVTESKDEEEDASGSSHGKEDSRASSPSPSMDSGPRVKKSRAPGSNQIRPSVKVVPSKRLMEGSSNCSGRTSKKSKKGKKLSEARVPFGC